MMRNFAAVLLVACSAPAPEPPPPPGWVDIDASELSAQVSAGTGRTRVVNFWATWCAPCLAEIPHLIDVATANPEVDLVFVSVDHPSVRARGTSALQQAGLEGQRVLHLGEPDPTATLVATVPGWAHTVPLTLVISPTGTRLATFPYAIDAAILQTAISGDRQ